MRPLRGPEEPLVKPLPYLDHVRPAKGHFDGISDHRSDRISVGREPCDMAPGSAICTGGCWEKNPASK